MIDREMLIDLTQKILSGAADGLAEYIRRVDEEELESILHDALADGMGTSQDELEGHNRH